MDQTTRLLIQLNTYVIVPTLSLSVKQELSYLGDLHQDLNQQQQQETFKVSALRLQMEENGKPPYLEGYKEGPHSLISGFFLLVLDLGIYWSSILDSLFSLIIFIYVSVTFLYMFYAFCWRDEHPEQNRMQISQQTQDMDMDDSEDEEGRMEVTAA